MALFMGKTAFVTGAGGFIGRHLVARLIKDQWTVHVLIRQHSKRPLPTGWGDRVTIHRWDESTAGLVDILGRAKADVVYHLASFFVAEHTSPQVADMIAANVLLGTQLLEAMAAVQCLHLVNFGTTWQHYQNKPYSPVCLYAATKQAFEAILTFYAEAKNVRAVNLKLFDTYGPDDDRGKLFAALLRTIKTQEPLNLSAGEQMVDFVYIDDVVTAALMAARRLLDGQCDGVETYAVSSGQPLSLRSFVDKINGMANGAVAVNWGVRPYRAREVMELWSDYKVLPGWSPQSSLDEGIKTMVASHV